MTDEQIYEALAPIADEEIMTRNKASIIAAGRALISASKPAVALDGERSAFEAQIKGRLFKLTRSGDGYEDETLDHMWSGWQSRAALQQPVVQTAKPTAVLDDERAALNGIPATHRHGEGAIARCFYCGRYSLDPKTLSDRQPKCECGEKNGWSGSFKKPGPDAKWSGAVPTSPQPVVQTERALTLDEYHEDYGNVVWWAWEDGEWLGEPAWIGTPSGSNWAGYHTHWTRHPEFPTAAQPATGD